MKNYCILLIFIMGSLFAYTPSPAVVLESKTLSNSINRSVEKQQSKRKTDLFTTLSKELPILQSRMIEQGNIDRAYVFEYVRRHLPGAKNIDTNDLIDDDSFGFTWTYAPRGFEVFYFGLPVPTLSSLSFPGDYSAIINGSYFSRTEGGVYPAGLFYLNGQIHTEFSGDDKQLTHIFCHKKNGGWDILENSEYVSEDDIKNRCSMLFQAGPLIYEKTDGVVRENIAPRTYIGSAHARTVLVLFEKENGEQDIWFLTVYSKMTLAQVRDLVLRETRFYGEYKNVSVLNLDGGSSVAYKSRDFPELTFGTGKKLPIIFGIK